MSVPVIKSALLGTPMYAWYPPPRAGQSHDRGGVHKPVKALLLVVHERRSLEVVLRESVLNGLQGAMNGSHKASERAARANFVPI